MRHSGLRFGCTPIYSSRWGDLFSYGQAKTEWRIRFPIHPYVSVRFIGDTTGALGTFNPIYLSAYKMLS